MTAIIIYTRRQYEEGVSTKLTANRFGQDMDYASQHTDCVFVNWNTNADGSGTAYSDGGHITLHEDVSLYAQWEKGCPIIFLVDDESKGDGYSLVAAYRAVRLGDNYGELPVPTRQGYKFAGWYTSRRGGTKITESTVVKDTSETYLFAHWVKENDNYHSGACGDNLTWTLDDGGVFSVKGTGAMKNYDYHDDVADTDILDSVLISQSKGWFMSSAAIVAINIEEGVTSIGDYAFLRCTQLKSVTIPNSVTSIGWAAFAYCSKLKNIVIPNSVTSIDDVAFAYCTE